MIQKWTLTDTTTLSGPRSNGNEGVLHTPKSSRTRSSPPDAVQCYNKDTPFVDGISYPTAGDTVSILQTLLTEYHITQYNLSHVT